MSQAFVIVSQAWVARTLCAVRLGEGEPITACDLAAFRVLEAKLDTSQGSVVHDDHQHVGLVLDLTYSNSAKTAAG